MIYDSTVTALNESECVSLLESVEDRFEDNTLTEAVAIIVGEQEANWTKFMKHVGLSELNTISEGQEVVYEGARLDAFLQNAKKYFEIAKQKLAEFTKSFINKAEEVIRGNSAFLKKYENELKSMTVPSNFEFKGYDFKNMEVPTYSNNDRVRDVKFGELDNTAWINSNKDKYSKEAANKAIFKGEVPSGDNLNQMLTNYFYGEKEKKSLNIDIEKQLGILRETSNMRKTAKTSYANAVKEINGIIAGLKNAEKEFKKTKMEKAKAGNIDSAFNLVLGFWKAYSNAIHQMHGSYLSALAKRNSQAKAICTKLISANKKSEKKEEKEVSEGFVNTEDFLGAIEFI